MKRFLDQSATVLALRAQREAIQAFENEARQARLQARAAVAREESVRSDAELDKKHEESDVIVGNVMPTQRVSRSGGSAGRDNEGIRHEDEHTDAEDDPGHRPGGNGGEDGPADDGGDDRPGDDGNDERRESLPRYDLRHALTISFGCGSVEQSQPSNPDHFLSPTSP